MKRLFFGYGFHIVNIAKTNNPDGPLNANALPELSKSNDVNNVVIKFDHYWSKEPKENPSLWRAIIKTLWKESLLMHVLFLFGFGSYIFTAYFTEEMI